MDCFVTDVAYEILSQLERCTGIQSLVYYNYFQTLKNFFFSKLSCFKQIKLKLIHVPICIRCYLFWHCSLVTIFTALFKTIKLFRLFSQVGKKFLAF